MQLNIYFTIKRYFPYNSYHNTLLQTVGIVAHMCNTLVFVFLYFSSFLFVANTIKYLDPSSTVIKYFFYGDNLIQYLLIAIL